MAAPQGLAGELEHPREQRLAPPWAARAEVLASKASARDRDSVTIRAHRQLSSCRRSSGRFTTTW